MSQYREDLTANKVPYKVTALCYTGAQFNSNNHIYSLRKSDVIHKVSLLMVRGENWSPGYDSPVPG